MLHNGKGQGPSSGMGRGWADGGVAVGQVNPV
jgi:hypothetical protein